MRDLRELLPCPLIAHRRGERDDAQGRYLAKIVDQFFGHAVGKILLGGVAGEIFERQNYNRADPQARVGIAVPFFESGIAESRNHRKAEGNGDQATLPEPRSGRRGSQRGRHSCGSRVSERRFVQWRLVDWGRTLVIGFQDFGYRRWVGLLEMESGDVRSAGEFNAGQRLFLGFRVVLGKLLADVGGLDADD